MAYRSLIDGEPGHEYTVRTTQYVVVLRARTAARFLPEAGCEATLHDATFAPQGVRIRVFTRWASEGGNEVPRELIVEVRGNAATIDDAIETFSRLARPVATIIGFVANVQVGPLEVHLAYDASPERDSREFAEVFIADERGPVSAGRRVRPHLVETVWSAMMSDALDIARLNRAMRHYELALRNWYIGGEWLALNHLWIAGENLTKAVVRATAAARGVTEEALARSFGLATDDPQRPRWKDLLGARVRQAIIFAGDDDTYQTAKSASDGLEHGIWELNRIAENAIRCTDKTFGYVRRSIIDLLGLDAQAATELMSIEPTDVESTRTIMRGRLVGSAADPAAEGQLYPSLEWQSGIGSVTREGTGHDVSRKDRFTVRAHPNVRFQPERLEVRGRLQHGQAIVEIADQLIDIEYETAAASQRVLAAVMPIVDAAAATGEDHEHAQVSRLAFNLFGQAVAFFRSITVLLSAQQPVEALPGLRALVILAARFEQMAAPSSAGFGIAVRIVCDEIEAVAAEPDIDATSMTARMQALLGSAQQLGLTVPQHLPGPETTHVYASLGDEMRMARAATDAACSTAAWHVQNLDGQHSRFKVTVEAGPFTDLIASAAAIAMLDLLNHAVVLFSWPAASTPVNDLLAEAQGINQTAAETMSGP